MSRIFAPLKSLIVGSPLEPVARKLYGLLGGRSRNEAINQLESVNTAYNEQTRAVMSRVLTTTSNCVDVGAHRGVILRAMVDIAPAGRHFAFEPLSDCCEYLRDNFSGVSIYSLALSDTVGLATFQHVTSNPEYSGLKRRRYDGPDEIVEEITIETNLLDNIIPESVGINFVKIDVEGAELQVLRGAEKTIRRCNPVVIFEHGLGAADHYGTTPKMIYDFFQSCGYRLHLMQNWLVGGPALSKLEFDDQFYHGKNFYFLADSHIAPPE